MQNVHVRRYRQPVGGWTGWIEPEDRSWILFVPIEGRPAYFPMRDENGGIIEPEIVEPVLPEST